MSKEKQYGLIIPKKDKGPVIKKPQIFNDNSDEEQETVEQTIRNEALRTLQKKQTQLEMQKALTQDPTVYEYDNIYDDLQKKKEIRKITKKKETGPKYIESLMKSAEYRKKEYERRTERKIQKERQEEGDEFADKEEFVTTSYKKKMEEMQREEEEERKRSILEAHLDVTKQSDLSGFYRHILKETTDDVKIKEEKASSDEDTAEKQPEPTLEDVAKTVLEKSRDSTRRENKAEQGTPNADNDSEFSVDSESSSDSSSSNEKKNEEQTVVSNTSKNSQNGSHKRKCSEKSRRRRKSASSMESSASSSSSESEKEAVKKVKSAQNNDTNVRHDVAEITSENDGAANEAAEEGDQLNEEVSKKASVKDIRELFKKRHVGEVFTAAKERYLARKAARDTALV